ncbi:LuxR family two component transcriptional regulator [Rhodobacter aestuarii]|uniref:Two component transcriptional regulator, LuxR family n=1 Tax=Rhodobacter aestuarii TaxID=453582 RepID=A0A1N7P6M9_9RHOB|nr:MULTISPECIES: response regulator transcription factor [Rhodobacter]PTV97626.1 LuxR family two component transcriptional regulator [Rhodobacter aestuarii]SIT06244.1 two component transcriptional regulator, LuxR family [Rhodobacter aestuarii]SOC04847.1 LuxR family two component transcriptional regulator [Rhodobacter sp. JA431]
MKLLIADDHDLVRDAIAALLRSGGCEEVDVAGNLSEALEEVAARGPFDLVLLDYDMPGMDGLRGLTEMKRQYPDQAVAIISGVARPAAAREALDEGAIGFVPKALPARSIIGAVTLMASGSVFAPFDFLKQDDAPTMGGLSPRETEVLRGICAGRTNKEIAREMDLQEVTVKLHVRTLTRKIGARNRTHAAMIAREHHWF